MDLERILYPGERQPIWSLELANLLARVFRSLFNPSFGQMLSVLSMRPFVLLGNISRKNWPETIYLHDELTGDKKNGIKWQCHFFQRVAGRNTFYSFAWFVWKLMLSSLFCWSFGLYKKSGFSLTISFASVYVILQALSESVAPVPVPHGHTHYDIYLTGDFFNRPIEGRWKDRCSRTNPVGLPSASLTMFFRLRSRGIFSSCRLQLALFSAV